MFSLNRIKLGCLGFMIILIFSVSSIVSGEAPGNDSSIQLATPIREEPMLLIGYYQDSFENPPIAKVLDEGIIIGYFVGTEWGDYQHLNIKDLYSKEHSFFISHQLDLLLLSEFEDNPEYTKKQIRVTWERVLIYIPEGGAEYEIEVAVKLEIIMYSSTPVLPRY